MTIDEVEARYWYQLPLRTANIILSQSLPAKAQRTKNITLAAGYHCCTLSDRDDNKCGDINDKRA